MNDDPVAEEAEQAIYHAARKAAEAVMGVCRLEASHWCSWHSSTWGKGQPVCRRMKDEYILIAEQAIEDAAT